MKRAKVDSSVQGQRQNGNREDGETIGVDELRDLYRLSLAVKFPDMSQEDMEWMVAHLFPEAALRASANKRLETKRKLQKSIHIMAKNQAIINSHS